ncbi:hypothetical protein CJ305_15395 [Leeuwenhoekiella nanhaiensis]|uniref:Uncharacterized protein n=1 Tax=Leeuwenhoekiella nanhaiensis TaxID=1655491 RepID=A0A2G1VNY1_9FLAO|nr:hypothetical protein CJ305_15395 [Leeuwenhoekiella nanhaiensis]
MGLDCARPDNGDILLLFLFVIFYFVFLNSADLLIPFFIAQPKFIKKTKAEKNNRVRTIPELRDKIASTIKIRKIDIK